MSSNHQNTFFFVLEQKICPESNIIPSPGYCVIYLNLEILDPLVAVNEKSQTTLRCILWAPLMFDLYDNQANVVDIFSLKLIGTDSSMEMCRNVTRQNAILIKIQISPVT